MKKITTILIAALMLSSAFLFASCSSKPAIGILQFGSHESLNNCYSGLLKGLEEGGIDLSQYNINFQNSEFDSSVSGVQAKSLADKGSKIILAITTLSAEAAINAAKDRGIPVVYTAVSDPVMAGFVGLNNVTGSSDVLNFDKQLAMIRAFLPNAKNIGVMYTTTETNSISQLELLKQAAEDYGFTIIEQAITHSSELPQARNKLLNSNIDAITNLTDNTIVGDLDQLLDEIKEKKLNIPVFGSEIEQVIKGCLASESLDYVELGRLTGLMAAKILKGEKTAEQLPFIKLEDLIPCYNSEVLKSLGLTLPENYKNIVDIIK